MSIRVVAIAAPQFQENQVGTGVLSGGDPVSLFNACRYAASLAENDMGPWGESNWAETRKERRVSTLLMHSLKEDLPRFEELLVKIQPNVLLIGAMSICLPGAIACAKMAKELLGDMVCVILGGRHATESIYLSQDGAVIHHPGSPLRLMVENRIEKVFDLVVSGEGEHLVAWVGEKIYDLEQHNTPPAKIFSHLQGINQVPGRWIVGWVNDSGQIQTVKGRCGNFDRNNLPSPAEMFGVGSFFNVFDGKPTAHIFSDMGSGCVHDCEFCSERRSVTGPIIQPESSVERLFRQMKSATATINEDHPGLRASAFIEDSTILGGSCSSLNQLARFLSSSELDLRFGGQLTIDQILSRGEVLKGLKEVGLDYIFTGVETLNPESVGGISKDIRKKNDSWLVRTEKAINLLSSMGIQCGSSLLFGLGESHDSRVKLLHQIEDWQKTYSAPKPIAINWAVQHPLHGDDGGTGYRYDSWGIPQGEWAVAFDIFGEASVLYPLAGQKRPLLEEVQEIANFCRRLI